MKSNINDVSNGGTENMEDNKSTDNVLQLNCEDVTIAYDKVNVVENVSLKVLQGDYVCIVGENGSGKSTLIKGILGLTPIRSGKIEFMGSVTKKNIGYLPQHSIAQSNFPASVQEVILSGCLTKNKFKPFYTITDKKNAKQIMKKLSILDLSKKTFGNLSGGQKQRVLLARALLATDKILFLDEPITGLDPIVTAEFYEIIGKLNKQDGMTIIMVSHDLDNAMKYANKILHIKDKGYFYGTKKEYEESNFGKTFLGESRNIQ